MSGKYDDIIDLPHPEPQTHPRMPMRDRAAQFAPFAALTGHRAALAAIRPPRLFFVRSPARRSSRTAKRQTPQFGKRSGGKAA